MKERKKIYGKGNIHLLKKDVVDFFSQNLKRLKQVKLKRLAELRARNKEHDKTEV